MGSFEDRLKSEVDPAVEAAQKGEESRQLEKLAEQVRLQQQAMEQQASVAKSMSLAERARDELRKDTIPSIANRYFPGTFVADFEENGWKGTRILVPGSPAHGAFGEISFLFKPGAGIIETQVRAAEYDGWRRISRHHFCQTSNFGVEGTDPKTVASWVDNQLINCLKDALPAMLSSRSRLSG
jgi:hypothetical protein